MARPQERVGEIVKEYLKKYPKLPDLTIAKLIFSEKPDYFKNVERARDRVRYYRGHKGGGDRKKVSQEFVTEVKYNYAPFSDMAETYETVREPYILPKNLVMLTLSDIHFPFQNNEALKTAIEYGVEQNCNAVYLNGDTLDCYQLSTHDKDPSKPKMKKEIELGRWFLAELRKAFPNAPIYYKIGNHEDRLERWLRIKGPEWLGTDEFTMRVLLEFAKNGVIEIGSKQIAKAGELNVIHGHEYRGAGGVNPARWLYLKTKASAICGHFHRASTHIDRNMNNEYKGSWTTGCLCELSPDYMPYNEWVHGFAIIRTFEKGRFEVDNKTIVNGKVF